MTNLGIPTYPRVSGLPSSHQGDDCVWGKRVSFLMQCQSQTNKAVDLTRHWLLLECQLINVIVCVCHNMNFMTGLSPLPSAHFGFCAAVI